MAKSGVRGDFAGLRAAFQCLSEIYSLNGQISISRQKLELSGIPRHRWSDLSSQVRRHGEMVRGILQGSGQRSSVQGKLEVVLSAIARPDRPGEVEICALLVLGRGKIRKGLTLTSGDPDWRSKLGEFTDWAAIDSVVAAAEGNNQRAMIGLVLQLAGIGRGQLSLVEAEIAEEVDEAAQSVRGADWLKAGLPRFETAAGEALWYLMRIRSVHARMVRLKKQGYYTAMALAAMSASGLTAEEMSRATGMSVPRTTSLTPRPPAGWSAEIDLAALGGAFVGNSAWSSPERAYCAARVWKGAGIYARVLDRRIRVGAQARARIGAGDDIVSVAEALKISRRDLVRVLSVSQADAIAERERFVSAIIDPDMVGNVCRGPQD